MPRFKDTKDKICYEVTYTTVGNTRNYKDIYAVDEMEAYAKVRPIMVSETLKQKRAHIADLRTIMKALPNATTEKELKKYTKDLEKFRKTNKC